ncbi:hypothetical protein BE04_24445 [Sorangium cellulosum]|uniref:Uncharacterized protein n=2 Tax=Sorangium cellulosum TaxID=56 RepID=A0A150PNN9_SORCE|nr:hypothetical protein [Sorangium cellulosum]AGP42266.1 hypothetical protein SCE1572_51860 [Sorangium cellulosum So0157-2]KYF57166.1 hypothetical protein BE04_24445 [Sorangium cellulosum]
MARHASSLEQRLAAIIAPALGDGGPFYEVLRPPSQATVKETKKDGYAEVACTIPEGHICIQWRFEETGRFLFLRGDKNADGALLFIGPDDRIEAHIIECKRKVTQGKWEDILQQMRWTLYKLLALAGVLGLSIDEVRLGTAYRFDELSEESSPNPTLGKPTLGGTSERTPGEDQLSESRLRQLAWENDEVYLPGFDGVFRHIKIQLDEDSGRGVHQTPAPRSRFARQL